MARRVRTIITVVDDLTNEELPEGEGRSVRFSWEGTEYEVDLSEESYDGFKEVIKPYLDVARKARPTAVRRRRSKEEMRVVRQWGRDNGYEVPTGSGRTPEIVIKAYDEAHR